MMFTQQTEAKLAPRSSPTISRGFQLNEESACKPDRRAPSGNKNAETHGYYRRKIKLEAVSFDDLNFSSSGGEQLRKRFLELLNHCGGEQFVSAIRRRIIERVSQLCVRPIRANSIANGHGVVADPPVTSLGQLLSTVGLRPIAESERALSASIIFISQTMLSS